ncbi:MAG: ABC transporter ATP-binding protein/permease [Alicyclobacillus mali]|uniref:ABC transporter ATP-binding protein n=1 Tax=Alicyclobacillus mali (ex Roth et al. 2021) TaxID=1123961 RepID=UPI0023F1EB48|nr:ABC transporter ATP-binding protein [Alicyclobacillus mali (ex Roth et al. 2021)]MCL6490071.1 ABC transporter ATP-binding protein/permease [Alicyclobacillus mali (ex Roth et al. 2021)]
MRPQSLLKSYLWEHRVGYVGSTIAILVSEWIFVQFPNVLGRFTDALSVHRLSGRGVFLYALLLMAIGTLYVFFYGIGQSQNGRAARGFEYLLRTKLFAHWETMDVDYFRQRSVGDLLSHAMNDVQQVREALSGGLNILTNAVFLLIATLVMTFTTVSFKLTVFSMIPLLCIPFFVVWIGPKVRASSRQVQEALSSMSELAEESFTAIRLVKATANEPIEVKRFADRVDHIAAEQMSLVRKQAAFQSIIPTASSVAFGIALLYGGWLTIRHEIPIGSFVAFTLYLGQLVVPLQQIGQVINSYQRASASMARLDLLLQERPSVADPPHPVRLAKVEGAIDIHLDAFAYPDGKRPVLRDIHLSVRPGQTLGIVGRTGSGKTTLVSLLPRIYDPPAGAIRIDGVDVRDLSLEQLRKAIAFVPQDGFLFSTTLRENIAFGRPDATDEDVAAAARAACLEGDVDRFPDGYDTIVGERGVTLSGGQRQRTAIARAWLKDAPILILDDSLSAVDMETEKRILASFRAMRRRRTVLIIAHRLSAVRDADWIVVMDEGRIAEQGTHDHLIQKGGIYAEMYRLQAREEEVS